jgi:hypothetical protein
MVNKAAVKEAPAELNTADPAEEYASVTITIDHLVYDPHPNGHTVVKTVWSTETAVESLLAQLDYFADNGLLRNPGILGMVAKGEERAAVFVYTVNESQTNVIVDAAVWGETLSNVELSKGTVMGAHAALITLATDIKRAAHAEGRVERVLAFLTD